MATLYIVATPIGNLEDITLRAIRVLKEAHTILCEDTRTSKKLLNHYDIKTPTLSFHSHSGDMKFDKIFSLLEDGNDLALISDAGTPTISDPGAKLVSSVREALPAVGVVTIPGPSAVTAALSVSGLPASEFLFLGFLPHKKGRQTLFGEIAASNRTVVFYESPHRILKALESLHKTMPHRTVVLAREVTKQFEEVLSGTPGELIKLLEADSNHQKGEFVVLVSGT
jgi:16S rRNA (cytidine1402-2'-O)-methyltransferase